MAAVPSQDFWPLIHQARRALAVDLASLDDADWRRPTLCGQWDVEHVVAHLTAVASVGRWAWLRSIAAARFRPEVHNERRLAEHLGAGPAETLRRFEQVVGARVAPTGDLAAYLGEVLVHGQDIRRPLGIPGSPDVEAWTVVAEFYAARDFAVNSRTMAKALRLVATDGPFRAGDGPEVSGPTEALVMLMAGRAPYLDEVGGAGKGSLASRLEA